MLASVLDTLNALGVPYIVVGSFSSNFYGIPRSTQDVDLVVELGQLSLAEFANRLGPSFHVEQQPTFDLVTMSTCLHATHSESDFRIEFFLLSDDPHEQKRFRKRREVIMEDRRAFLPTPEDVIITKLRWAMGLNRSKDQEDVQPILLIHGQTLDWDYMRHWCRQHGTIDLLESIWSSITQK